MINKRHILNLLTLIMVTGINVYAQKPREVQIENDPPDLSNGWTIMFLIVIPLILIVGYIFLRKKKK